jgi:hypothetical protein
MPMHLGWQLLAKGIEDTDSVVLLWWELSGLRHFAVSINS